MTRKAFLPFLLLCSAAIFCKAQTVPENTGSKITQSEAQAALDFHNKSRMEVSVKPLVWSADLAKYAQEWADYLAAHNNCQMAHRKSLKKDTRSAGENIFWGSVSEFTPLDASQSWFSEIKDYIYQPVSTQNYHKTGHYSQMVWKSTKEVGMGISVCKDGAIIVVANYFPPGNVLGEKPY